MAFGHRTNHTLRTTPCATQLNQMSAGLCEHHNVDLLEYAYHCLALATGRSRYSRRDIHEEALRITRVEGCRRTALGACVLGSSARKSLRTRNWSGCYSTSETHHEKRQFLKALIQEDLRTLL